MAKPAAPRTSAPAPRPRDWTIEIVRPDGSLFYRLAALALPDEASAHAAATAHLAMVFPPTEARIGLISADPRRPADPHPAAAPEPLLDGGTADAERPDEAPPDTPVTRARSKAARPGR